MAALSLIKPRLFYGFLFKLHAVYAADLLMPDRPERPEKMLLKRRQRYKKNYLFSYSLAIVAGKLNQSRQHHNSEVMCL
ncbi:MAG: hypothetical protein JNJ93_02675 [Acinetobacter sp.]|nr:hypothetical protein [Acinetobacter sp.]